LSTGAGHYLLGAVAHGGLRTTKATLTSLTVRRTTPRTISRWKNPAKPATRLWRCIS